MTISLERPPVHRFLNLDDYKPLTERQIQVLELMSRGYYYKEIADILGITVQTAKNIGCHISDRLNALNRAHAIRLGFEQGYLRGDG